jgi:hypothetical protein
VVYTGGKFAAGVIDTSGKFADGIVDTGGKFASTTLAKLVEKFASSGIDTGGAPWLANISGNFRKNLNRSY